MADAASRWAAELAAWAVPAHILEAAPQTPWVFPPDMFSAPEPGSVPRSGSTAIAAAAIPDGGTVLDVGCGGGAAAFALVPPATALIGTDRQTDMVEAFAATAERRGIPATVVPWDWPDVADRVPQADVAVSHNVLYNVADLAPFAAALHDHARRRVVIEITERHPQVTRAPLWKRFWDLDRPEGPTAWLAAEVLRDAGFDVATEQTLATQRDMQRAGPVEAAFWCRQLCLPPDRIDEVAEAVADLAFPTERVTLWWDVS
ncbi:hypothetical protein BH23ACT9_BH23ACT9_31880 [soil metagenome]